MSERLTYRQAGVDIDAGDGLIDSIKPFAKKTMRPEVLAGIGGFGALCELPGKFRHPVLVSSTDGVGTKLKLAFALERHDTIGVDLVAMSANDVLVQGAEPLFFLDYFACGQLEPGVAAQVIKGVAYGCELAGCALIGGETAEMPGMYPPGEYDLAGFCVGVVEKARIVDGRSVAPGDALLGLASSGAHSNGYSLIRKIIERANPDVTGQFDGRPFGEVILEPTRIYVKAILRLLEHVPVKAMAHITGGGITGNVPRMLPAGMLALIESKNWPLPALFQWLQREGDIALEEMHRVFNCGIGMVLAVASENAAQAVQLLRSEGETVYEIGFVEAGSGTPEAIIR